MSVIPDGVLEMGGADNSSVVRAVLIQNEKAFAIYAGKQGVELAANHQPALKATAMQIPLVMTSSAPDRTGLVEKPWPVRFPNTAATGWKAACAGWAANSRAFCASSFRRGKRQPCSPRCKSFPDLQVVVRGRAGAGPPPGRQTNLKLSAADRPGIVREITSALARAG
jgi:hypothetical protein